jgi:hypothetical protein
MKAYNLETLKKILAGTIRTCAPFAYNYLIHCIFEKVQTSTSQSTTCRLQAVKRGKEVDYQHEQLLAAILSFLN